MKRRNPNPKQARPKAVAAGSRPRRRRLTRAQRRRRFWAAGKRVITTVLERMQPGARCQWITNEDIYERDDWTCQVCGQPVRRTEKFPHPESPSIDHVKPLAEGGDHVPDNVRCTHLRC